VADLSSGTRATVEGVATTVVHRAAGGPSAAHGHTHAALVGRRAIASARLCARAGPAVERALTSVGLLPAGRAYCFARLGNAGDASVGDTVVGSAASAAIDWAPAAWVRGFSALGLD